MNFKRPWTPRTEDSVKRLPCLSELPPFEAGLTAALRRAYAAPLRSFDEFDDLLAKLA